jgi:hypothetical protein
MAGLAKTGLEVPWKAPHPPILYPRRGVTNHRENATRMFDDVVEHDRQKLFGGKSASQSLCGG